MRRTRVTRSVDLVSHAGAIGAFAAAIAAPCCFPLFAAIGAAAGLSALNRYEPAVLYVFQAFALLSLLGLVLSFRRHRRFGPLSLSVASVLALAYAFYWSFSSPLLYAGLFGLLVAALWNWISARHHGPAQPILRSVITCPLCGHATEETMPANACLFFFDCPQCHGRLKPKPGDCCVFCSYGSVPCPPIQIGVSCCAQ